MLHKFHSATAFTIFLAFVLYGYVCISEVDAATIQSASCSLSDVQTAITSATIGDTVNVPAGNCTWNTRLDITKGLNLIGAGIGNTVITIGTGTSLIKYSPATTRNDPFRISGFTFDLNDTPQTTYRACIILGDNKVQPFTVQTNI